MVLFVTYCSRRVVDVKLECSSKLEIHGLSVPFLALFTERVKLQRRVNRPFIKQVLERADDYLPNSAEFVATHLCDSALSDRSEKERRVELCSCRSHWLLLMQPSPHELQNFRRHVLRRRDAEDPPASD